jgi:hypothetical protein
MWKYTVEQDRPQMAIWRTHFACCIHTARVTHSEYVIPVAFLLQQCLHKRASILSYTYIYCLVQSCETYDTFIHPVSCCLMTTIQLNPPELQTSSLQKDGFTAIKIFSLQFQLHFGKLEIFFLSYNTRELRA